MVKVTLKFDLDDPSGNDTYEHRMALNGHKYYNALVDIKDELRGKLKYWTEGDSAMGAFQALEWMEKQISDILRGYNIILDEEG